MTLQDLRARHPERFCICRPHLRDPGSGQVVSWICLRTFDDEVDAVFRLEEFVEDGVTDAVLISTVDGITMEGDLETIYRRKEPQSSGEWE